MTARELLAFSLRPALRSFRRWWINRQLEHIRYQIAHLQSQRENDRQVERVLQGREAVLRSDLRNS
ncbi:MAG TPA: hypothetical protein VIM12_05740 [Noviherbaspirillum sp.]|jgi:hypothetical protein|uniref:hypothetical protein n=1 Tax=Noviherbaspirillum sp. TaxID=1926288 RepID=UPI002F956D3B